MRYRIFGQRSGLKVSEIVLGAGMFGKTWGYGADPDEVRSILQGYAAAGGNFIDTADNYQHGESERLIGEFVALIATTSSSPRSSVAAPWRTRPWQRSAPTVRRWFSRWKTA